MVDSGQDERHGVRRFGHVMRIGKTEAVPKVPTSSKDEGDRKRGG